MKQTIELQITHIELEEDNTTVCVRFQPVIKPEPENDKEDELPPRRRLHRRRGNRKGLDASVYLTLAPDAARELYIGDRFMLTLERRRP